MSGSLLIRSLAALLILTTVVRCGGGGGGGDSSGGPAGSVSTQTFAADSDSSGIAEISFTIEPGVTSVQMVADSAGNRIHLTELRGPSGDLIADSVTEKSTGLQSGVGQSVFGFPTLQSTVLPGSYSARYFLSDKGTKGKAGAPVSLTVASKRGAGSGVLPVNIVFVGAVSGSERALDSFQSIVKEWATIYSRYGITLDVQVYSFDGPRKLPDPRVGDPLFAQISNATRHGAINMVIGEDTEESGGGRKNEDFGEAGGIPGSIFPGPRSAVTVSIEGLAGKDGRFNYQGDGGTQLWSDEELVAAEELCNLAGQYLGLQEVVTFQGDKVIGADRLADTDSCITEVECENEDTARKNVMFPRVYKKDGSDDAYDRDQLTSQQVTIMKRNPLVR